jgi:S-DNA-T family DNA segregation ATPase FtsK/SpoIIIE
MELSAGEPLFARFAYATPNDMASLLEDAVSEMRARAGRLRGKVRPHTPSATNR